MSRRCTRSTFTLEEYAANATHHWRLPRSWGAPGGTLAQVWKSERASLPLLPLIGQFAFASSANEWVLSLEESARVLRCDPQTVTRGADGLVRLGLVDRVWVGKWFGQWVTRWAINARIAEPVHSEDYFYFSSKLLYGGNWAMLSAAQQALYLATATQAHPYTTAPQDSALLRAALPTRSARGDFDAAWAHSDSGYFRATSVSHSEIGRISGLSRTAISTASSSLYAGVGSFAEYSPLWIYTTKQGSRLYHFRDHVSPWPWDVLNALPLRATAPEFDDDLPF